MQAGFIPQLKKCYLSKSLALGLIGLGCFLRLHQYFFNRSLWLDEAKLALNILERPLIGLFAPLGSEQTVPIGFLILEKLLTLVGGSGELILRFLPLIFGLLSVIIFYALCVRFLESHALPLALFLFAVSDRLIYYSSEVKSYALDVLLALVVLWAALIPVQERNFVKYYLRWALAGAAFIWFSHPIIFVLAAVILLWTGESIVKKRWFEIKRISLVAALWIGSLFLSLATVYGQRSTSRNLLHYWQDGFMPLWPMSVSDWLWFPRSFVRLFQDPLALTPWGLWAIILFWGFIRLWQLNRRAFFILSLPITFHLIASGLHQYPFQGRLTLYTVPTMILWMAIGLNESRKVLARLGTKGHIVWMLVLALILYQPAARALSHIPNPRAIEELRPIMHKVRSNIKDSDALYLYHGAKHAFKYYAKRLDWTDREYVIGRSSRHNMNRYYDDLDRLKGHSHVWVVFSHTLTWNGVNEESYFLQYLDELGEQKKAIHEVGASAYLYDLS